MHKCPAPACEAMVATELFACRTHWFALPRELRTALLQAWQLGDLGEHAHVREQCVRHLELIAAGP